MCILVRGSHSSDVHSLVALFCSFCISLARYCWACVVFLFLFSWLVPFQGPAANFPHLFWFVIATVVMCGHMSCFCSWSLGLFCYMNLMLLFQVLLMIYHFSFLFLLTLPPICLHKYPTFLFCCVRFVLFLLPGATNASATTSKPNSTMSAMHYDSISDGYCSYYHFYYYDYY